MENFRFEILITPTELNLIDLRKAMDRLSNSTLCQAKSKGKIKSSYRYDGKNYISYKPQGKITVITGN